MRTVLWQTFFYLMFLCPVLLLMILLIIGEERAEQKKERERCRGFPPIMPGPAKSDEVQDDHHQDREGAV